MRVSTVSSNSYLSSYEKKIQQLEDQVKDVKRKIQNTTNSADNMDTKHQKFQLIQAQIDKIAMQV